MMCTAALNFVCNCICITSHPFPYSQISRSTLTSLKPRRKVLTKTKPKMSRVCDVLGAMFTGSSDFTHDAPRFPVPPAPLFPRGGGCFDLVRHILAMCPT